MKKIGLTGGIGSGKSTVLKMFQKLGAAVYIADVEAKRLMHSDENLIAEIVGLFGEMAYKNGVLNREMIASIVFNDKLKLNKLNKIVHPAVHKDFENFIKSQKAPYIIYESALLFENGIENQFDKVILVTAPINLRFERVIQRDNSSKEQIQSRMKNQLDDKVKLGKSDYIIENIALENTTKEVRFLHDLFSKSLDLN